MLCLHLAAVSNHAQFSYLPLCQWRPWRPPGGFCLGYAFQNLAYATVPVLVGSAPQTGALLSCLLAPRIQQSSPRKGIWQILGESVCFQKPHLCSHPLSWLPEIVMPMLMWIFLTGITESISQLVETCAVKKIYTQQENPPPCCGKCMTPINPNESDACFEKGEPLSVWL